MPRGKPVRTDRARERFLETLRISCNVSASARAAGIGRATAYQWRDSDPDFAAAWKDAEDDAVDSLEQVAWERATDGGSDRMMEILLKGHRPQKYAKTVLAGDAENPIVTKNYDMTNLTIEQLEALEKLGLNAT